jgi:hypothetical protein
MENLAYRIFILKTRKIRTEKACPGSPPPNFDLFLKEKIKVCKKKKS